MPVRLAACDPCRSSKLACDHNKPVCTRCRKTSRAEICIYRERPFKKKNSKSLAALDLGDNHERVEASSNVAGISLNTRSYPNPGYLGFSSHATIYAHLLPDDLAATDVLSGSVDLLNEPPAIVRAEDARITHGVSLIKQINQSLNVSACNALLNTWLATGVDLALATSFTQHCAEATHNALTPLAGRAEDIPHAVEVLLQHSCRPLRHHAVDSLGDFCAQFCQDSTRWETLGLFFTAVTRAAGDIRSFDPIYTTEQERRRFQKLAIYLSDQCLDLCISLDCLNDLQLVLQYENFIAHAGVDGDQSYSTWRKLGDVISSLFALGYHDQSGSDVMVSSCLRRLRRAAFARAYSADKNMSIFLGRPPRMLRKYCRFQLPDHVAEDIHGGGLQLSSGQFEWIADGDFDYVADTRWSGLCSILKEEILDLRNKSPMERVELSSVIQSFASKQWSALPVAFRLEGALKSYNRKPIERDFMISAKLNHLHVLFLLHLALTDQMANPGPDLITVSSRMISLVTEAVLLRECLANSGTGLIWSTMYYGLPAAGIICIALLNGSFVAANGPISKSRILQDLNVLVAEVEIGNFVHSDDPNYALLTTATKTVRTLLDSLATNETRGPASDTRTNNLPQLGLSLSDEDWNLVASHDFCDFEMDFWLNLAEHPILATHDIDNHNSA